MLLLSSAVLCWCSRFTLQQATTAASTAHYAGLLSLLVPTSCFFLQSARTAQYVSIWVLLFMSVLTTVYSAAGRDCSQHGPVCWLFSNAVHARAAGAPGPARPGQHAFHG